MWKNNKISILRLISQTTYLFLFIFALVSKNVIFTLALISAALIGPLFCGWLCFFGFYQDLLRYIGMKIKKDPIEIDDTIHQHIKFARYFVLAGAVSVGSIFLFPDYVKHSLSALLKGHPEINFALLAMLAIGILSLFTKRFYCRYLCTFGAKQGLYSLIRPFTIKRDKQNCIGCKACSRECPMHINMHEATNLAHPNCINCFKCIEICPKKCLKIGLRNYKTP